MVTERFWTVDHTGTRRVVTLELESNGPKWVKGREVDASGTLTERFHVIDTDTIVKRRVVVMNPLYGEYEELTP